jgi:DivIVA domain-containing protein
MPFAPHEIENKRFVVALRGYQQDEVEAFLRAVAADYRAVLDASPDADADAIRAAARAEAAEMIRTAEATVAELRRALPSRDDAEREAEQIRAAARAEAAQMIRTAEATIAELRRALPSREDAEREAERIREAARADAEQIRASAHAQANVAELRLAAQAHARELREAAEAEAEEIRTAAEREAHEIRDAAIREAEAAYAEITRQAEELRRLEASLWSRMHALEHTVVECRQALSHVSNLQPMTPQRPLETNTLPSVDELLYRVEAASLGTETNVEVATADL